MTDQEEIGGKRKGVRRNGTENFIDGANKQRGRLKENGNERTFYAESERDS